MLLGDFNHEIRRFWVTEVFDVVNLAVAALIERSYDLVSLLQLLPYNIFEAFALAIEGLGRFGTIFGVQCCHIILNFIDICNIIYIFSSFL